ncbi:hypothetical protein MmiAt1_14410 [Methanimicrococcus sp. At1]|uniref:Uncharacterized protein n=1 Tax=Methanimicrococcus hacksteinii TaxID=3028293 RepID=A0ABU3VR19_9EURY|nr:DUF6773 family protein [Methanimicrococcus sp. At1]MDV0445841.1 hypothetical protein [Methanimicrococcus sp. At1]
MAAKSNFDEKQLIDRNQTAFETMMLIFVLLMISIFIKIIHGPWAAGYTEESVFLFIPMAYFFGRSTLKGANFSMKEKNPKLVAGLAMIAGLLCLVTFSVSLMKGASLIENGMLSGEWYYLLLSLPVLSIAIAYLIRSKTNKTGLENLNES